MDIAPERESNGSRPALNSTGEKDFVSEATFQFMGGLSIVIILIGIPGNVLVIASVSLNKHLRTAANFLVLSLSVFDFLYLSTVVPVHTYTHLTGWEPPAKLCWAVGFLSNWLLACSVLSTGSIAINRYIAIVLRSKYRQISGNKAVVITCIIVFLFPFFLLSPAFEGSLGTFGYEDFDRTCGWLGKATLKTITIVIVAIFPLVFMTLCYIRIVVFVVHSRMRVGGMRQAGNTNTNRNRETRLSQMLALVYIVYLLTALPTLSVNIVAQIGARVPYSAFLITWVVVWMSSAANPVMYGLVNKKYRDAYKNVALSISSVVSKRTVTEVMELNAG